MEYWVLVLSTEYKVQVLLTRYCSSTIVLSTGSGESVLTTANRFCKDEFASIPMKILRCERRSYIVPVLRYKHKYSEYQFVVRTATASAYYSTILPWYYESSCFFWDWPFAINQNHVSKPRRLKLQDKKARRHQIDIRNQIAVRSFAYWPVHELESSNTS